MEERESCVVCVVGQWPTFTRITMSCSAAQGSKLSDATLGCGIIWSRLQLCEGERLYAGMGDREGDGDALRYMC